MSDVATVAELPWHFSHWQRFLNSLEAKRLPHAILLTGSEGLGKRYFANRLAANLLCSAPTASGWSCGKCRGCQLLQSSTHPDCVAIEPEEPGKAIKIDTIREFVQKESLTSQLGGYKVIIIEPADALNVAAANSLLKTLEEPITNTVMVLISDQPGKLPATIRSRCSLFKFTRPEEGIALDWLSTAIEADADAPLLLSLANGAPLKAVALSDKNLLLEREQMLGEVAALLRQQADPVIIAARWDKLSLARIIEWFAGWVIDMIRIQVNKKNAVIINIDQMALLRDLGSNVQSKQLHLMLEQLYQARRTLGGQLNTQMLLEGILLKWSTIGGRNE